LNWTSASETVGFATSGMENSQLFRTSVNGQVILEPELFTPDTDGYHDQLHIIYKLPGGGWMGNIKIYSDRGIEIRRLLNNDWLGTEGSKAWDGTDDSGEKAPVGIYIVYFELFNAQGQTQLFKQTCVLGSKL
jgi:flagellar hook assembly protein FlgD